MQPSRRVAPRSGPATTPTFRALHVACAAAALLANACTLSPNDGQNVTSTTASLSFFGLSNTASQQVKVEVTSGSSTPFVLGMTTTSPTVSYVDSGTNYFAWSMTGAIPMDRWVPGTTGSFAKLHTRFVGAGTDGSDSFGYTFRTDWSSCHARNPNIGNFLTRCKSPRSPDWYVYTADFPAGADFVIVDLREPPVPGGRIPVIVRNGGRPGVLRNVTCSGGFSIDSLDLSTTMNPGDQVEVDSFIPVTGSTSVTCTASGTSEQLNATDGTFSQVAETNTTNNGRVETL